MALSNRGIFLKRFTGLVRSYHERSTTSVASSRDDKQLHEIPGPTGLPVVGNLFQFLSYAMKGKAHLYHQDLSRKFGDFYKITILGESQVIISDPDLIEDIFRKEIKTPKRPSNPSWDDYRFDNNQEHGLLTSFAEEWQKNRSALNKQMLRPKNVNQYCEELSGIVSDLITRFELIAEPLGEKAGAEGVFIHNLSNELYKWSLESISSVMFETRLGCLKEPVDPKIQNFIDNINSMWYTTVLLYAAYGMQRKFKTKYYKRHMENWDVIFQVARENIERRTKELEMAGPDDRASAFLTRLLLNKDLSQGALVSNVAELLMAAVDTTSNTTCFMLFNLANNEKVQQKLYDEIKSTVGVDGVIDVRKLEQMDYLKMCLKENYRMFPVAPINARILTTAQRINGYIIPKDTLTVFSHYTSCRNSKYFHDPEEFIPERWSRTDGDIIHPFASLPFGHGSRSCIGRRFAELELKLGLIQILRKFEVKPHKTMVLNPFYRTILSPGKEVPIVFHRRDA
ncbi:25-hydroxyvitamin D-1 alpha hydroxylase, mitochondrial-like [Tubulanus polymorphus]|uniref:25-hydroxyvitamin D-1 alpha hydroxylase, mitochondrial-like n=1 Tax=Tubulanus polymorphus TaxID=672921 RepID=UPI003DA42500